MLLLSSGRFTLGPFRYGAGFCFCFGHCSLIFVRTLYNSQEKATCNLRSKYSSVCETSCTCCGRTREARIMSLTARFDRKIFVTVRNVLIFIMTTTTLMLLKKLRMRNVEMKAMNAASLSDKLIVSFAVVSKDVCSSVMSPETAVATTLIGLK